MQWSGRNCLGRNFRPAGDASGKKNGWVESVYSEDPFIRTRVREKNSFDDKKSLSSVTVLINSDDSTRVEIRVTRKIEDRVTIYFRLPVARVRCIRADFDREEDWEWDSKFKEPKWSKLSLYFSFYISSERGGEANNVRYIIWVRINEILLYY